MNTLRRTASRAVIALALALVAAAPAAAAQPTRTLYHPTGGSHPAGEGCAFDITYVDTPGSRQTVTDYGDGREATDTHAVATLTNATNGKTFVHKAFFHDVYRFDPATNTYVGMTNGQVINWFFPGDVSPWGIVGSDGLAIRFEGTIRYTYDASTFALIAFSYQGTATDVCELLS